jgi:hypothetical protein
MPRSFIKPYVVLLVVLGLCACVSCSTITVKSPSKAKAQPVTEQQARRVVWCFGKLVPETGRPAIGGSGFEGWTTTSPRSP